MKTTQEKLMEILHPAIHGDPAILRILVEEEETVWLQALRDGFSVTPFAQAPSA